MTSRTRLPMAALLAALMTLPIPGRSQATSSASDDTPDRAAEEPVPTRPATVLIPDEGLPVSDKVSINVNNADIVQVLNAFSLQTGRSLVVGPDVTGSVNMRLNNVGWEQALEVMLSPYGFGHKVVADTIVINKLDKLREVEQLEPLHSRVYKLSYLDARDVQDIITAQLSGRGSFNILTVRGQKGWRFETGTGGSTRRFAGVSSLGKREREDEIREEQIKSKVFIVSDITSVLDRVDQILSKVDRPPLQVLIEARFVEVTQNLLQDIGVDFGTGATGGEVPGVQTQPFVDGDRLYGAGLQSISGNVEPGAFGPMSDGLSGTLPFTGGMSLMFQQLTDTQFQVLLHLLEENQDANFLSAPRVMTLNNQEATIIVGTKFPIIRSEVTGQSGAVSTSLEYYENIGIQLNVVPQVCDQNRVNMIVHPAVTTQIGTTSARAGAGIGESIPLTEYPILDTREAETQIMVASGQTVVIAGLLQDREKVTQIKVPYLGDVPVLGRLFRRDVTDNDKLDLLIFLTATIMDEEGLLPNSPAVADAGREAPAAVTPVAGGASPAQRRAVEDPSGPGPQAPAFTSFNQALAGTGPAASQARDQRRQMEAEMMRRAEEARSADRVYINDIQRQIEERMRQYREQTTR